MKFKKMLLTGVVCLSTVTAALADDGGTPIGNIVQTIINLLTGK